MSKTILLFILLNSYLSIAQIFGNGVLDYDGNFYKTILFGNTEWTQSNLKVKHYNDGEKIDTSKITWYGINSGFYASYNNSSQNELIYGLLYNWNSVNTNKLCPKGWRVPSLSDWIEIIDFLGGSQIAGSKLKEKGITHWNNPNFADNSSGFTALPGGYRTFLGKFQNLKGFGYWWSSTEYDTKNAQYFNLQSTFESILYNNMQSDKSTGFSVRCVNNSKLGLIEINELNEVENKKLSKIVDVLGREIEFRYNEILIYVYEDGTTKKFFINE